MEQIFVCVRIVGKPEWLCFHADGKVPGYGFPKHMGGVGAALHSVLRFSRIRSRFAASSTKHS